MALLLGLFETLVSADDHFLKCGIVVPRVLEDLWDFLLDEAFNGPEVRDLFLVAKGNGSATGTGPARSSDPVDIAL